MDPSCVLEGMDMLVGMGKELLLSAALKNKHDHLSQEVVQVDGG